MIFHFPQNPGQAFDRRFRNIASRFTSLLGIYHEPASYIQCSNRKLLNVRLFIRVHIKVSLKSPDLGKIVSSNVQF